MGGLPTRFISGFVDLLQDVARKCAPPMRQICAWLFCRALLVWELIHSSNNNYQDIQYVDPEEGEIHKRGARFLHDRRSCTALSTELYKLP